MVTPFLKFICRTSDLIIKLSGYGAATLMPVLAGVVVYEVFSRYILNQPTVWASDTALFLFGYIAALGGAYAEQKRAHINVDILYLKVSGNMRRVFDLFTSILGMFFLSVMFSMALGKYEEAIEYDYRTQSEWGAPMWHFWIMVMVAAALFMMQLIRDAIANLYCLITSDPLLPEDGDDEESEAEMNNKTDNKVSGAEQHGN